MRILVGLSMLAFVAGCGGAASPTPTPGTSPHAETALPSGWSDAAGPASAEALAVLEGRMDAFNRGDYQAAAAYWVEDGDLIEYEEELIYTKGREQIAARLEAVRGIGVRMEPAGTPLQFGRLVAEPVRFVGSGYAEGLLVFKLNDDNLIVTEWVTW